MKKENLFKVNEVSLHYKLKHDTTDYPIIKNSNDAAEILFGSWDKYTIGLEEQSKVLYLNRRNQVIGLYHFSTGNINGTIMCNKKIFACGLKILASSIIIAHNHPSGNRSISKSDLDVTKVIKATGEAIDMRLNDHIIILPNGSYVSLADENLL